MLNLDGQRVSKVIINNTEVMSVTQVDAQSTDVRKGKTYVNNKGETICGDSDIPGGSIRPVEETIAVRNVDGCLYANTILKDTVPADGEPEPGDVLINYDTLKQEALLYQLPEDKLTGDNNYRNKVLAVDNNGAIVPKTYTNIIENNANKLITAGAVYDAWVAGSRTVTQIIDEIPGDGLILKYNIEYYLTSLVSNTNTFKLQELKVIPDNQVGLSQYWSIMFSTDESDSPIEFVLSEDLEEKIKWVYGTPLLQGEKTYWLSFIPIKDKILGVWTVINDVI